MWLGKQADGDSTNGWFANANGPAPVPDRSLSSPGQPGDDALVSMSGTAIASLVLAIAWLAAGVVLLFDIGHLPYRLVNRGRAKRLDESAISPLYWRTWGAILIAAAVVLAGFGLRT